MAGDRRRSSSWKNRSGGGVGLWPNPQFEGTIDGLEWKPANLALETQNVHALTLVKARAMRCLGFCMQQGAATVVGGRCLGHGQDEEQREMLMAQNIRAYAAGSFSPGWTSIQSTPGGMIYRNAGTGATAIGEIDSAGNHVTK